MGPLQYSVRTVTKDCTHATDCWETFATAPNLAKHIAAILGAIRDDERIEALVVTLIPDRQPIPPNAN